MNLSYSDCHCKPKLPEFAFDWQCYVDQLGAREKKISNIDQKETNKLQQRKSRILKQTEHREREEFRAVSGCQTIADVIVDDTQDMGESSMDDEEENIDVQYVPEQNRRSLKFLSQTCDRYAISDRAGASIANAVLRDYELLQKNPCDVIDPSKIFRERQKWGKLAEEVNAKLNRTGHQRRHQYVLSKANSIIELKEFNIKKDYIELLNH